MFDKNRKDLGYESESREGSQSMGVRNCQKERFFLMERVIDPSEVDLQGRGLRTFDVDTRFVDVPTIQTGP